MQDQYSHKLNQEELDNQIDLANLFKIILKRKSIILIFSFFGILFSSLHIYSQERIYSGSFSFVFEKNNNKQSMPGNLGELSFLQDLLLKFLLLSLHSNNIVFYYLYL